MNASRIVSRATATSAGSPSGTTSPSGTGSIHVTSGRSDYEGPGYRALFEEMWSVITRYDAKTLTLAQARRGLWSALERYQCSIPLRENLLHHEWALRDPRCRDLFLGMPEKHERWGQRLPDPHLADRHLADQHLETGRLAVEGRP
jgi:hypothetical protein